MDGFLRHTPITHGRTGSCDPSTNDVPKKGKLLASFHNHGGFSEDYDSEVPTVDDLDLDKSDGIIGFIATPGGRVWRTTNGTAKQLCRGCVPQDPNHDDAAFLPVKSSYTLKQLKERGKLD